MENRDLPAMPIELSGFGQFAPEAYTGLTKREMFAMHAAPIIYNLYSTDGTSVQHSEWRQGVVIEAVRLADLLLDELERTK